MTAMEWYAANLRSRGESLASGVIRLRIDVEARDDVEAAMLAKEEAKRRFPERKMWLADAVHAVRGINAKI